MIMIYHSLNADTFLYGACDEMNAAAMLKRLDRQDGYRFVADIHSDDKDEAYRLTNHIDAPWNENIEVNENANFTQFRSTSVGDLMICPDGIYAVAPSGFDLIRKFCA